VVGELEDVIPGKGLEVHGGGAVQRGALLRRQALEQRLADLVVHEGAAPRRLVDPDHVAPAGVIEPGHGLRRPVAGERDGLGDVELLAEHGADREQPDGARTQRLDAAHEDDGGAT
jgi:hypothetical protein